MIPQCNRYLIMHHMFIRLKKKWFCISLESIFKFASFVFLMKTHLMTIWQNMICLILFGIFFLFLVWLIYEPTMILYLLQWFELFNLFHPSFVFHIETSYFNTMFVRLRKKIKFSLRISSVTVIKPAYSWGFNHI